ncbi:MAG: PqqD family peptide modification chaperone [Prevotellaceae bacterium]|nr:PqqD family peptide modification chaperone [Prevotellaceae bacterium]
MKIKEGFELRNVCGENIIIAHGIDNIDFTKVITLNDSAAMLWNAAQGRDFKEEELVELLLNEYEVDAPTAHKDVNTLINSWTEAGLVEK